MSYETWLNTAPSVLEPSPWWCSFFYNVLRNEDGIVPMMQHARRFLAFYHTIEACRLTDKLFDRLRKTVDEHPYQTNPPSVCLCCGLNPALTRRPDDGPRPTIGADLFRLIWACYDRKKACLLDVPVNPQSHMREIWLPSSRDSKLPITWWTACLRTILPDTSVAGWEYFECSHLCTNVRCIGAQRLLPDTWINHLTWESKANNQERGRPMCLRACTHCGKRLCDCQHFHNPPCINRYV